MILGLGLALTVADLKVYFQGRLDSYLASPTTILT